MKNKLRKITSLLIISIILISYFIPNISRAEPKQFKKYLALGDSIAYGYGLENRDSESYAAIVKSNYNIADSNFQNLAVSGMTCAEFYEEIQKSNYTQAIENVELITISIGSNEILELATAALSEITGIPSNDPAFLTKVQNTFITASLTEKARILAAVYSFFTSEETQQKIDQGVQSYETNWKKSVDYIKSKNPNATIVATEFYNPYYDLKLGTYDISDFCNQPIERLNTILHNQSNNEQNYKIAKIYDSFNTTNPRITNVTISATAFNLDPHPNKTGHSTIASKIMDELATIEAEKINIKNISILDIPDQKYTGQEIKPKVTIRDGNKILEEGIDYTVEYRNNKNEGTATIVITGKGDYEGTDTKTFKIIKESSEEPGNNNQDPGNNNENPGNNNEDPGNNNENPGNNNNVNPGNNTNNNNNSNNNAQNNNSQNQQNNQNNSNSNNQSNQNQQTPKQTNNQASNIEDNTTAKSKLPKAGKEITLAIVIVILLGNTAFLSIINRKYRDVK